MIFQPTLLQYSNYSYVPISNEARCGEVGSRFSDVKKISRNGGYLKSAI